MQPCTLENLIHFLSRYGTVGWHTHVGSVAVCGSGSYFRSWNLDPTNNNNKGGGGYL